MLFGLSGSLFVPWGDTHALGCLGGHTPAGVTEMLNVERNRGWVKAVQHAGTHLPRGLSTDMGQAGTHHLEPRQSAGMSVTGDTAFSR